MKNNWAAIAELGMLGVAMAATFACGYCLGSGKERTAQVATSELVRNNIQDNDSADTIGSSLSRTAAEILRAKVSDFPSLWETCAGTLGARHLLVARWIDLDLEGAKTFFSGMKHDKVYGLGGEFMVAFAQANRDAALDYATGLPSPNREIALQSMLGYLTSTEPAFVLDEVLRSHPSFLDTFADAIIQSDPTLAPRVLDAVKDQSEAVRLLGEWAKADSKTASTWAARIESPETRSLALQSIIKNTAMLNPEATGKAIEDLDFENRDRRRYFVAEIAKRICDATDAKTGVDWVLKHCPPEVQYDALYSLSSDSEGSARLQLLQAIPEGEVKDKLTRHVWINWSGPMNASTIEWINENIPDGDKVDTYGTIGAGFVARNFGAALRALNTIPPGPERDSYEMQVMVGQAKRGGRETGEAAMAMIQERYDEARAHEIIASSFPEIAGLNAEAASVFLDALPSDYRNQHPDYLMAEVWARQDPDQAMAWAAALPEGDGRERALSGLQNVIPANAATAEWFNALPPSTGRDNIAQRLVRRTLETDPPNAFAWAQSINDDAQRGGQLINVVKRWAPNDPVAAATAICNAAISDREKQALALRLQNQLNASP
ncbi:MAG: hypothetical protein KDN22_14870 [Verrucomicrobiae bacterium]|nr:hypothetical protein [Verrucomicrobiae bacterium]